ncbi:MAG: DEAD/DEAH box helicase [Candidatus Woesearchaeota archaeon]
MLKDFTPRLYQETIFSTAAQKNTLAVLPTGMGKTALAFMLAAQRLKQYPSSKILVLSPTKPLCEQHVSSFRRYLEIDEDKIVLFTGNVSPEKRAKLWKEAVIIVSTPQGLENDVINKKIDLEEVSLLVFDESHHATGDYSYVWLAKQYNKLARFPRILALTASPGSDLEKIKEICTNLFIEEVEVRTPKDADVQPYIQKVDYDWVKVSLPEEFLKIKKYLEDCYKSKLKEVQGYGYCSYVGLSKTDLLKLQGQLQGKISSGDHDLWLLKSVSLVAEALKVQHALELLETQGVKSLHAYLSKLRKESLTTKVKAVQNLVRDGNFKSAVFLVDELVEKEIEHPKMTKLREIIVEESKREGMKLIIFTQFRDSASEIVGELDKLSGISAKIFVGQVKKGDTGLSQKKQKEILDQFRAGEFNVLCCTSVGEEGLDIPAVDLVIFYEPVPSAIRTIQRKGRTGRLEKGRVLVLMTEKTRDEGYRWSAFHKEKKMYRDLEKIKKDFSLKELANTTLDRFVTKEKAVLVLADHREKHNWVVKELIELGISLELKQLESADYILSGRVGVELKTKPDFVASIIDGRLLEQMKNLRRNFERSLLVIEGEEDLYSLRKVHANAIRGMLAAITIGYGVPILYTKNAKDTAGLLAVIAKREQDKERDISLHERKPLTLKEQQEFLVSALPGVGLVLAQELLKKFGSIKNLANASVLELQETEKVGEKISMRIKEVLEGEYPKE